VRMRVLLADDHETVLERITDLLSPEFEVLGTAKDGESLIAAALHLKPDIIVTDISMPGLSGIEASRELLKSQPDLPIVVLTMHRDIRLVQKALDIGIRGYVHKMRAGDELLAAIESALQGQTFVSSNCRPVED
jgi:DNA-binding NarL/FixJ family response regulator